eukprot:3647745-Rhodomonas_salina.1
MTCCAHWVGRWYHGVVWDGAGHAVDSGLDVLLVARQVHERHDLGAFAHDLRARLGVQRGVVDQVAPRREANHMVAHA